jgi:hypothetical protein
MKEQAIQYLAMDVHQATVVACKRDERGAITMRATVIDGGAGDPADGGLQRPWQERGLEQERSVDAEQLLELLRVGSLVVGQGPRADAMRRAGCCA